MKHLKQIMDKLSVTPRQPGTMGLGGQPITMSDIAQWVGIPISVLKNVCTMVALVYRVHAYMKVNTEHRREEENDEELWVILHELLSEHEGQQEEDGNAKISQRWTPLHHRLTDYKDWVEKAHKVRNLPDVAQDYV